MELVVLIIMLMVGLSFLLKTTYHGTIGMIVISAILALFVVLSCEYAVNQSKTQISDWLSQPGLMLDTSVLLTIDVACQIAFCFLMSNRLSEMRMRKSSEILLRLLLWIPGITIFPVLFSMLVEVIFSFSGIDFQLLGWGTAAAVFVAIPLLAYGLKILLPDEDMRLEMMFLVNLITIALGIVATVNGRTAAVGTDTIEWDAMIGVFAILFIGFIAGIIINNSRIKKQISKLQ